MAKVRLELDSIQVDSFSTTRGPGLRGTVAANSGTDYTICWGLCGSGDTCGTFCGDPNFTTVCDTEYTNCGDRTCADTCNSCNASCAGVYTYCQNTCIEQQCLATQPPYCDQ